VKLVASLKAPKPLKFTVDNDRRIVTVFFDTPIKTGEEFTLRTGIHAALLMLPIFLLTHVCCSVGRHADGQRARGPVLRLHSRYGCSN
jgi:hypothetical protein